MTSQLSAIYGVAYIETGFSQGVGGSSATSVVVSSEIGRLAASEDTEDESVALSDAPHDVVKNRKDTTKHFFMNGSVTEEKKRSVNS